jgi:tetratricopeptide (TPR) repeat protein
LHELLRQFARAELEEDPDRCGAVLDAHAGYYGALAAEAFALFHSADQPLLLATIESDLENIRVAWRHYLAKSDGAAISKFVGSLWVVYEFRGWYPAAVSLFDEALDALDPASDDQATVNSRSLSAAVQAWFLGLLGRPEVGAAAAGEAVEALRSSDDLVALWVAIQSSALCLAYLGKLEEMIETCDEAMAIGQRIGHPFWAAAMMSWRSFGGVISGDFDSAARLLPEGFEVLTRLNEHYYLIWNLWSQASLATHEGRFHDAIALHSRQVALAEEIGYLRGSLVAFEGLGDANQAAGQLEAAETAYIEGIGAAEQTSMVTDMLGMMTKVARVRASTGRQLQAVELLATVHTAPASAQQPLTDTTPINEVAAEMLRELQQDLDSQEYEAAHARGTSKTFEVAAKEMLSSKSRRPPPPASPGGPTTTRP